MESLEGRVEVGEIASLVRAAALGAREGGVGDQPYERMRVVSQRPQPVAVALDPRVCPQRMPARRRQRRRPRRGLGGAERVRVGGVDWLGGYRLECCDDRGWYPSKLRSAGAAT